MKKISALVVFLVVSSYFLSPTKVFAKVWINEFSSYGLDDWVEFYNDGTESEKLSSYKLRDGSQTNEVLLSGEIGPKGFLVFEFGNIFNKDEDIIKLVLQSDESAIFDQVLYGNSDSDIPAPGINQTAGRESDGGSHWAIFATNSKNSSNSNATIQPTPIPSPTNSPTPSPTPKTPTPTKTPTPIPTATKSPTPIKSGPTATPIPTAFPTEKVTVDETASHGAMPTSVLGASDSAQDKIVSDSSKQKKRILIQSASKTNWLKIIPLFVGAILLIACGILIFLKLRKQDE